MANTITQSTIINGGTLAGSHVVKRIVIVSDGSEETDLVIYDNSAHIADVSKGTVRRIEAHGSSCQLIFEWDQTTDFVVAAVDPSSGPVLDFRRIGGIRNPGGTGATGDLVLTTTNLDAGDVVTIEIEIGQ